MKRYKPNGIYQYGEFPVLDEDTKKLYTLTQRKALYTEDHYNVYRYIAVPNVGIHEVPEKDFYVYEFSYMTVNSLCVICIVDEETALKIVSDNLLSFMQGNARSCIEQFFSMKKE